MEITNITQPGQQEPATQSCKHYSEQELHYCLNREVFTVKGFHALIESNFEKDKRIAELTQSVADLTKRIATLEKKTLEKPGRPRREFWLDEREVTDEYLMQLIDEGYFDSISKLEKYLGAGKNQLRNRYNKAKKKLIQERKVQSYGNR